MRIIIDAGHSLVTPGKRSPDETLREYQFNAACAALVTDMLMKYEGVEVRNTHNADYDIPLKDRTDAANAWPANLFVSIHANAFGDGTTWTAASGIETYVYITRPAAAVKLANAVQRHLIAQTGRMDRGVKAADYHVLRETNMSAILVECGYFTNREECELLKTDAYRMACALAITAGIVETYGLKLRVELTAKAIIQSHCQFEDPMSVWALLDKHPYADAVYKKWVESYQ
jgi:N-acetylmuramoyl-L-alanine amidase